MSTFETIFLLFLAGILMLLAELFLPTQGLLGILGIIAILVAVGKTFWINQWAGVGLLLATMAAIPFAWSTAMKIWPKTPFGRRLVLPPIASIPDPPAFHLGQIGVSLSQLRPMGLVDFGGKSVEATCEIGVIEAGRAVTVTSIQNRRPVVRAV
ncbi:hypothetical protein BH10PLA1_BH10PLA1_05430 [soil metagenome]